MRYKVLVAMLILGLMLVGCNNHTKQDMQQELAKLAENQQSVREEEKENTEKTDNSLEEIRSMKLKSISKTAEIHISSAGYETAKLYSASQKIFTKITLMQMAETLFDKGSIQVRKPYQLSTSEDIDEELKEIKAQIKNDSGVVMAAERKIESENGIVLSMDVEYTWREEADESNQSPITQFNGEFRPQDVITKLSVDLPDYRCNMDVARIMGTRDGDIYELIYTHEEGTQLVLRRKTAKTVPADLYNSDNDKIQSGLGENLVSISEAREQAEEILQEMGCGDFVEKNVAIRSAHVMGKVDAPDILDGYQFIYVRPIGHVEPVINSYVSVTANDGSKESTIEYAAIEVDSDGVFAVTLSGLYEKGACLAEEVSLLSVDQIIEIASSQEIQPLDPSISPLNLKLEFSYIPIRTDNNFTYMPVWILSEAEESWMYTGMLRYDNPLIIINAVDGSIYQYKQMTLELRDSFYSVLPQDSILD